MKNKPEKKYEITKKMSFSKILSQYPEAAEILAEKGMHCFSCAMAMYETLEQGCIAHGMNPDKIVKELNKKIKENEL